MLLGIPLSLGWFSESGFGGMFVEGAAQYFCGSSTLVETLGGVWRLGSHGFWRKGCRGFREPLRRNLRLPLLEADERNDSRACYRNRPQRLLRGPRSQRRAT